MPWKHPTQQPLMNRVRPKTQLLRSLANDLNKMSFERCPFELYFAVLLPALPCFVILHSVQVQTVKGTFPVGRVLSNVG